MSRNRDVLALTCIIKSKPPNKNEGIDYWKFVAIRKWKSQY